MIRHLRNAFVSGLLLMAPVGVTAFVINFLIQKIGVPTRAFFFFFIPKEQISSSSMEYTLYVAAVLVVVLYFT